MSSGPFQNAGGAVPSGSIPVSNSNNEAVLVNGARPLVPKVNTLPVDMERRKNEIVQEMLQRIRPFLSATGQLRADADFDAFASLMVSEAHYVQRTLLLTVVQSAVAEDVWRAMSASDSLVRALAGWLNDCAKEDSPLLVKILEVLGRLPLSIDQLVEHRLGKIIKKLSGSDKLKDDVKIKAEQICSSWTKLARQEDANRRNSTELQPPKTKKILVEDASRSLAVSTKESAVVNMSLFTEATPHLKTRAAQILERVARGETSKVTLEQVARGETSKVTLEQVALGETSRMTTRPLSADDIHKAKKRQLYLREHYNSTAQSQGEHYNSTAQSQGEHHNSTTQSQGEHHNSITQETTQSDQPSNDPTEVPTAKRVKKQVRFADDDRLVTIRIFETPDDDYYFHGTNHHHRNIHTSNCDSNHIIDGDLHEMDRNEASFAFKQMALVMEAECDWQIPKELLISKDLFSKEGDKSTEKGTQELRERTALSATYFNPEDIPLSPSESLIVDYPDRDHIVTKIPLQDVDGRVVPVIRFVSAPPTERGRTESKGLTASDDVLKSLLSNPNALQDILKNVSVPPATGSPSRSSISPHHGPKQQTANRVRGNNGNKIGNMMPPRMPPPMFPPPIPGMMPPLPFGVPPPPFRPPIPPPPSSRNPCKFYKRGKPNSCRNGSSCQFYHDEH